MHIKFRARWALSWLMHRTSSSRWHEGITTWHVENLTYGVGECSVLGDSHHQVRSRALPWSRMSPKLTTRFGRAKSGGHAATCSRISFRETRTTSHSMCWTRSLGAGMNIPWWTRASAHVGYRNSPRNDSCSYWVVAILMLWRCHALELTPMRCLSLGEVFVAFLSGRSCRCASAGRKAAEALRNTNNFDADTTAIVKKCNDAWCEMIPVDLIQVTLHFVYLTWIAKRWVCFELARKTVIRSHVVEFRPKPIAV